MNTKPNFNLDRTFFTVISALESGTIVQPEIDPDWDRSTVLEMAKEGQFDTVLQIIECNPVEETSRIIPAHLIEDEIQIEARASQYRMRRDPNHEHRIGNFEAGTGSFGPFAGRAA